MRMAKIVRRELAAQTPRCSRSALVGVGGARLLDARLVARAPASNRVGMECGHRVAVSAVNLKAVADVNVAVAPEVGAVLPRSIDDVTVESDANWLKNLLNTVSHVGRGGRSAVLELIA